MKSLPGLPSLPTGYWWEIHPSRTNSSFRVDLMTNRTIGPSNIPKCLGRELTRSWPRPTARTLVRTAKVIHARWVKQTIREASPFVGKFRG